MFPYQCILSLPIVVVSVQFTEDDYSFSEGESDAEVCLEAIGQVARPGEVTVTVSSVPEGTATGTILYRICTCVTHQIDPFLHIISLNYVKQAKSAG